MSALDDLELHLLATFSAVTASKADALEMQLAGKALGLLGVVDEQAFLTRYATTVGEVIFLPDGWTDVARAAGICHELTHVLQCRRSLGPAVVAIRAACAYLDAPELARELEGPLSPFAWDYLLHETSRAGYEAEAYTTTCEVLYWLTGTMPALEDLGEILGHYGCGAAAVQYALDHLEATRVAIRAGVVVTTVGREAIAWLTHNAPELRAEHSAPSAR